MNSDQLDLLREALPYIQRFKGETFIIKLSGAVTANRDILLSLTEEIALFHQVGFRVVVIHGGGKQLNEMAEKMGVPQTIINGRRVTDSATLELAQMVFTGKIRTDIVSCLRKHGAPCVGLSGLDGNIIRAKKRETQTLINRETGLEEEVDFGHVGDIVEVDDHLLENLLSQGYVPVISSLGADEDGNVYNINADTIAAEIAVFLQAEKIILLSNVDGVYKDFSDPNSKISKLTLSETEKLIQSDGVSAGMIPKLSNIIRLLHRGVSSAHIVNGTRRNVLLQEIFTDEGSGTMIYDET